jgi:hypothetical protein
VDSVHGRIALLADFCGQFLADKAPGKGAPGRRLFDQMNQFSPIPPITKEIREDALVDCWLGELFGLSIGYRCEPGSN